jgi:hypothetical protein
MACAFVAAASASAHGRSLERILELFGRTTTRDFILVGGGSVNGKGTWGQVVYFPASFEIAETSSEGKGNTIVCVPGWPLTSLSVCR